VVLKAASETIDKRYTETRGEAIFSWNEGNVLINHNKNKHMESKTA
jgi:hypothetical protein